MNKNTRTAKEIIKIAQQLTAGDFDNENEESIINSIVSQAIDEMCNLVDKEINNDNSYIHYTSSQNNYNFQLHIFTKKQDVNRYIFTLETYFSNDDKECKSKLLMNIYKDKSKLVVRNVENVYGCKEVIKKWLRDIEPLMIQIILKAINEKEEK